MAMEENKDPKSSSTDKPASAWRSPAGVISAVVLVLVIAATFKWGLPRDFKLFGMEVRFPEPTHAPTHTPTSVGGGDITRDISRETFAGRWQVEQSVGSIGGATYIDWYKDGTFEGTFENWENASGVAHRIFRRGTWNIAKTDSDRFKLTARYDDGETWTSTFEVLTPDKIENKTFNYVAYRVPR
jgi:hypothetical protein